MFSVVGVEESESNKVIIDWVSFSAKDITYMQAMDLLGLSDRSWEMRVGFYGYHNRLFFESISIHYDNPNVEGVCVEMSGQGCRAYESYSSNGGSFLTLVNFVFADDENRKFTRLDVAYDDHSGILDIGKIASDVLDQNFVSKASAWEAIFSSKGTSVVIGSQKSEFLIRIYDKARERGYEDGRHWVRVELQMRRDRCTAFLKLSQTIGERFSGVLLNYLRFVEPQSGDSNKWRWPLRDYWTALIQDMNALSIYEKPGVEYNLLHLERYCIVQAGNAIDAAIEINGIDGFLEKLHSRKTRPNPKYQRLIEENKLFIEERKKKENESSSDV